MITGLGDAKPATPETVITDSKARTASSREPYRELIERWLEDGRHAMSTWQELVEERGFTSKSGQFQPITSGRF